jgi:hypothetical protein
MTRFSFAALATAALVGGAGLLAGCDSASNVQDTPPASIAPAAFTFDTASFPDDARIGGGANFANAYVRVGLVSIVVGAQLILPHAATDAATSATPTVSGGTWTWATTTPVGANSVRVRLEGTPEGSAIDWRMQTAVGADPLATFYTGTTSLDGQSGQWRLFYPDAPNGALTADFDVRSARKTITFGVPAGRDGAGSSVRYESEGRERLFDWRRQPENVRAVVEWDATTGAGAITAEDYNGGARACWNAARQDVAC